MTPPWGNGVGNGVWAPYPPAWKEPVSNVHVEHHVSKYVPSICLGKVYSNLSVSSLNTCFLGKCTFLVSGTQFLLVLPPLRQQFDSWTTLLFLGDLKAFSTLNNIDWKYDASIYNHCPRFSPSRLKGLMDTSVCSYTECHRVCSLLSPQCPNHSFQSHTSLRRLK